jgi:hypothetical protein
MKTFAHFSSGGVIDAVVIVDAPEGVTVGLQLEAGQMVAELDSPELTSAAGDVEKLRERDVEKLRKITKRHKVAPPGSQLCKLTRAD